VGRAGWLVHSLKSFGFRLPGFANAVFTAAHRLLLPPLAREAVAIAWLSKEHS